MTLAALLVLLAAPFAPAQKKPAANAQAIVSRMNKAMAANQASLRQYTVTRDYRLYDKNGQTAKSRVVADVQFMPPGSKSFVIRQSDGNGMGKRIAREMLTAESELVDQKVKITPDNYGFTYLGEGLLSGRRCFVLALRPKRLEKTLLLGKAWVDAQTFLLHRLEGEPAKKPSWWVRDLHVAIAFAKVGGMWLQTAVEFTAGIRLFGESRMVVRDLKYSIPKSASVAGMAQTGVARRP